MNPVTTTCGRCGHTMHGVAGSDSPFCTFPGCACAGWTRPQCLGSQGASTPGACPGRPFIGGHDPGCPDGELYLHSATTPGRLEGQRLSYSIDPAAPLVHLVYRGGPSFDEWERTMRALLADPAYRPGFPFLVDRRFGEPASTDFVRLVADFLFRHEDQLAGSRWAIVAPSPASYGMARMKQALADRLAISIEVFRELGEAERWLGRGGAV